MNLRNLIFIVAGTFFLASKSHANLNEEGFESYEVGELSNQSDWKPQAPNPDNPGSYIDEIDRVEIRQKSESDNMLVWLAGFPADQQTRLLKSFPPVSGDKVIIRFDYLPGHTTVPGRLIFDSGDNNFNLSIRFLKGTLQIVTEGGASLSDTGLEFTADEWNKIELQCDFVSHQLTVVLNEKKVTSISLPEELLRFQRIILFGGGIDFESCMDNLSIEEVLKF